MLVDVPALAHQCAPSIAYQTVQAIVMTESGAKPFSIGINGSARITRQPLTKEEAVATATTLIKMGLSIDMGLGQINSANLGRLGLTVEQVFDPCTNLRAVETILRGCYDPAAARLGHSQAALQAALSCYNTGNTRSGISNGYVGKVYAQSK